MADDIVLTINGQNYTGWTEARITRGLMQGAADFEFEVSEGWAGVGGKSQPWQIKPGDTATITVGGALVLTGYVDHYEPSYSAEEHRVRIIGRSKTCDLVDCMPDIDGGQFDGYTLDAIANAAAAPFGIKVVTLCDVGDPFPVVTLDKTQTAYEFLETLARQRSVIVTDDENGNLVLTQTSSDKSSGALTEGQNILAARANLSMDKRFQTYVVLSQTPLSFNMDAADLQCIGTYPDPQVTRYRRFAEMSETPLFSSDCAARAKWRAKHAYGEGTLVTITAQGFRQTTGGDLWKTNLLIPVTSPMLALQQTLAIGKVSFLLSENAGSRTELELAPQEAFTPEPVTSTPNHGDDDSGYSGGPN